MDHHDIFRRPGVPEPHESWQEFHPDEEVFARFDTRTVCIGMTDDRLFGLEHMRAFAQHLQEAGNDADFHELPTRDGHDGFLRASCDWRHLPRDSLLTVSPVR